MSEMNWPDLSRYGCELVVGIKGAGRRLVMTSVAGRAIPLAVRKIGFRPEMGRWVRDSLQIAESQLRSVFPAMTKRQVGIADVIEDHDELRRLRRSLQRAYGDVDTSSIAPATPDALTATRARAIERVLGVKTCFVSCTSEDPRLRFGGVTLRERNDRTVFVNVSSPYAAVATIGHEAVHVMRREDPALYQDLVSALRPAVDAAGFGRYAERLEALNKTLDGRALSLDEVREEAVADIVGDLLLDHEIWGAVDDASLVTRLLEWLRTFLQRLSDLIDQRRPVIDQVIGSRELLSDVKAARDVVIETLQTWRDRRQVEPESTGQTLAMAFRALDGAVVSSEIYPHTSLNDSTGRPVVVFRGEYGPENEHPFDSTRLATPTFTESPDVAHVYALAQGVENAGRGRLRAYVLDVRNPLMLGSDLEDIVDFNSVLSALAGRNGVSESDVRDAWMELSRSANVRHYTAAELGKPLDSQEPEFCHIVTDSSTITGEDYTDTYSIADSAAFTALAQRAGYDGFTYWGTFTSPDLFQRSMSDAIAGGFDDHLSMAKEHRVFSREQVTQVHSMEIPEALRSERFRRLYHGSPHAFEQPSLETALSGEGFNAQGHGFYMSERAEVADGYRAALSTRNRVYRIDDKLIRSFDLSAELDAMFLREEERSAASLVCQLLTDGWGKDDIARMQHGNESLTRAVRGMAERVERVGYGDIEGYSVYIGHRDGSNVNVTGERGLGFHVARRDLGFHLQSGMSVEVARTTASAEIRQQVGALRAELEATTARLRLAEKEGSPSLEQLQVRARDDRWFLHEAVGALAILEDPDTLIFDVRGWVSKGHLYEGELEEGALLLDWDQPLSQQAAVIEALRDVAVFETELSAPGMALYRDMEATLGSAENVSAALMAAGISGVRYLDGQSRNNTQAAGSPFNYVIWDLEALSDFRMRFKRDGETGPQEVRGFYSALLACVEAAQGAPRRADARIWEQWLDGAQRRGEFRKAEREWLGVDEWLRSQPSPISRNDLCQWIATNQVQLQELVLEPGAWHGTPYGAARFSKYQLPGGAGYRELLMLLPEATNAARECWEIRERGHDDSGRAYFDVFDGDVFVEEFRTWNSASDFVNRKVAEQAALGYRSKHFPVDNLLVHVRFNERTDSEGNRVLFIEEVQSDWHQAGRKEGYVPRRTSDQQQRWDALNRISESRDFTDDEQNEYDSLRLDPTGGRAVPDAPFKGAENWSLLVFKRMTRWAVENGYDTIAWTTGDQQAERYDLAKQVRSIAVYPDGETRSVRIDPKDGRSFMLTVDRSGIVNGESSISRQFNGQRLDELIGKEVSERVMQCDREQMICGKDFALGGEGMRGYYDKILPNTVGGWARRFGAKIEMADVNVSEPDGDRFEVVLPNGKCVYSSMSERAARMIAADFEKSEVREISATEAQWSMHITSELREAALAGLPLFRRVRAESAAYMHDERGNMWVVPKTQSPSIPPHSEELQNNDRAEDEASSVVTARF